MSKKLVAKPISFADSEYKSFEMTEDATLTINMNSWQGTPFRIIFSDVIQFSCDCSLA